ncbi:MAG: sigma 54-interacting transcriptional regulator, partial [Gammaproteobacteria bacterium]
QARAGALRLAAGGTLFLDEIGELPLELQPKLLRALEERAVWPVGSDTPVAAAPRVVAATNRDLGEQVRAGRFREDLWYRLNVVNIHIPPLRERLEDIPVLVEYLLGRYREELGRPVLGVEREAMRALLGHGWRGNVRELANVLERAVLLGDGPLLRLADLPAETLAVISSAATSAGASERLH